MRFVVLLALPAALLAQTPADTTTRPDSAKKKEVRRRPVTPELERSAFADARARTLLTRAREARITQDSALRAYDAKTYFRVSVGMGFRRIGRDRLLFRSEQASRVRWARGSAVYVEPTGRRMAFPMGDADVDMSIASPVPYFPGREALWMPDGGNGRVRAEVNEDEMLHPLATGAEAYYRYQTGDSVRIALPDGRAISLRELRITARRPDWRAFVGSFWFDTDGGALVRAAYRMSAEMDIWAEAGEEKQRELEAIIARGDTGAVAEAARKKVEAEHDDGGEWIGRAIMSPMRANLSAVTVEYGLHEGRFWLPKLNVAEGSVQAGFVRMPLRWEESFRYESVNGDDVIAAIAAQPALADDDTLYAGAGNVNIGGGKRDTSLAAQTRRADSAIVRFERVIDSLRTVAADYRAKGDTSEARETNVSIQWYESRVRRLVRRREACARGDSTYLAGALSRTEGMPRLAVRLPCNEASLANSPDLPGSIYDGGEELFGASERDALMDALGFGLQPGWGPQKPVLHVGLDLLRYNRIEGFSPGAQLRSELGRGYRASLTARIGTGDWVPNAEATLARSNGRSELRLTAFHRLGVANDDWGAPLSLGASLANLLYARDEGFYYRTFGAELSGERDVPGPLGSLLLWRLFGEAQRSAGSAPNTQVSLANLFGDTEFERNIDAVDLVTLGAAGDLSRTFGSDPRHARLDTRWRLEGAGIAGNDWTGGYGRLTFDGTLSRPLGRFAGALTGAAGGSLGDVPTQRLFYVGGLQTVRGQFARPTGEGRVGDAFWLGRAELGLVRSLAARPTVFYDVGWAGARQDFARRGVPLSGAGAGLSILDGLLRFDVSKGIRPERFWRADVSLEARF